MNFDNVRVEIRPRTPFEAVDLGFVMARHWFLPLWFIWLAAALPFAVILHIVLYKHLMIAAILVWWLKPVYERPLVFWLSRAFFNEKTCFRKIIKHYFSIIKPRILSDLTYLRFAPSRSFFMPVAVLENLNRKDHYNRVRVLGHNQSAGMGLTVVCMIFNMILNFSMLLIIFFILPEGLRWTSFDSLVLRPGITETFILKIIAVLAMSFVAPFYVAAGFALYINRRTELEAWDIEISFKRLMSRKETDEITLSKRIRKSISSPIIMILLLTSSLFFFSHPTDAKALNEVTNEGAASAINKVLDHEDFGKKETITSWKLKEFEQSDFDLPQWLKDFLESLFKNGEWTNNIPKFSGIILEIFIWAACGLLIVFLVYKIVQNKQWFRYYLPDRRRNNGFASELFGLDMSEKSLPDDIVSEVKGLLEKNEIRKALSLLYRGTLIKLIKEFNLSIPKSATENECVKLVKLKRGGKEIKFFETLTKVWLAMAYGHIIPEKQKVSVICNDWQYLYGIDYKKRIRKPPEESRIHGNE